MLVQIWLLFRVDFRNFQKFELQFSFSNVQNKAVEEISLSKG